MAMPKKFPRKIAPKKVILDVDEQEVEEMEAALEKQVSNPITIIDITKISDENEDDDPNPDPPIAGGVQRIRPEEEVDLVGDSLVEEPEFIASLVVEDAKEQQEPEIINDEATVTLKDSANTIEELQSQEDKEKAIRIKKIIESTNPVVSVPSSMAGIDAGVATIVCSVGSGKRITFPLLVLEKLGNPFYLQVGLHEEGILLCEQLTQLEHGFPLKKQGTKGVIYAAKLVEEIKQHFSLDFTNRVSITFHHIEYYNYNGYPYAFIYIDD